MLLHPSHAILDSQSGARFDQRTINLGFVALLHVAVIFAVARAFVPMVIQTPQQPIDVRIIEIDKPKDPDVPLPPPLPPRIPFERFDAPDIPVAPSSAGDGPITILRTNDRVANLPPDTGPVAANERTTPPYPPLELRLGHEGKVTLMLSIADSGAVTAAHIVLSSGYERLDATAQAWVQEHWRYKPAIQDGRAVASTTQVSVTFNLRNAR